MRILFIYLLAFFSLQLDAQKMSREQYVSKYFQLAVQEMNLYKIPASITLAQGILETESGNSDLCQKAKNHFGIKCQVTWTGMKFIKDDDTKNECFRAYTTDEESFRDHSVFLLRSRYEKLFLYDMADYRSWAYGLKEAGYATNPKYPQLLIKHIEDLKLYQYDNFGNEATVGTMPTTEEIKNSTTSIVSKEDIEVKVKMRKEKANNLELIIIDETFDIYKLAEEKNISIKSLMLYNDVENEQQITPGQNFFLESKKNKNTDAKTHIVKNDQSLYDISQIYGVHIMNLRMYNKLELWEQPAAGEIINLSANLQNTIKTRPFSAVIKERTKYNDILQQAQSKVQSISITLSPTKIDIPTETAEVRTNTNSSSEMQWITYKVRPKETLFKISKNFACNPNDILIWNNLSLEEGLSIGQSLKINTNYPKGIFISTDPKTDELTKPKTQTKGIKEVPKENVGQVVRRIRIVDTEVKPKPRDSSSKMTIE